MFLEESLIFFPARYPQGEWNPPGLAIEECWFDAADGTRINGWFLPHDKPTAVVLFACGNGGNMTWRVDRLRHFHDEAQASAMVFDYRGYGKSSGNPTEKGVLEDARAARRWLAGRAGVAEVDVVLVGESLGGAVFVDMAARDGARGLVLESTFTSLPDMAAHHYPVLPVRLVMRSRLDSLGIISRYRGPLLACHGDADTIVPFELGQRLFAAANEPKKFIRLRGHDHNDPLPDEYLHELAQFIRGLGRSGRDPAKGPAAGPDSRN